MYINVQYKHAAMERAGKMHGMAWILDSGSACGAVLHDFAVC